MPKPPFTLSSIQSRLLFVVMVALALMLGGLGTISWIAIRDSTARSLDERLALAQTNADHLGYVLNENLVMLGSVVFTPGVDMTVPNDRLEQQALHEIYITSIFDGGLYVVDAAGRILMAEPQKSSYGNETASYPPVLQALSTGKPLISNIYEKRPGEKIISAVVPVSTGGAIVGAVVGDIYPLGQGLRRVLPPLRLGDTGYIDIVDSQGIVVASSISTRALTNSDYHNILQDIISAGKATTSACHNCHSSGGSIDRQKEIMAVAPLPEDFVKWGVVLRQSESEALAPSRNLLRGILAVSIPTLLLSIILAWGMAQSVMRPIVRLTGTAHRLSSGDLSQPISTSGNDEISTLSRSLESMRLKLNTSLEEIRNWNTLLESKVEERTKELERLYSELRVKEANREELLRKVMTIQEEERKRLARDLHDDTSQTLAALVMQLDTYAASSMWPGADESKLNEIRMASKRALDSIRRIILDLRPSILDDLGLVSAIRWYAETRLLENGVKVRVEATDYDRRLPNEVETALFRIVQEAVTNIARHAEAENAVIAVDFRDSGVFIEVEDDGKGFDAAKAKAGKMPTFGLQGMEERVYLLGGTIEIESEPGSGVRITVFIPLGKQGGSDA
ncbi:MAG: histidine kinase [Dehalococcoidia bacterium]|nr:histidine kinase [Dehalococcoidia bacterium]